MVVEVGRRQVLAHRVRALGLCREANDLASLGVVDLGVQDTPPGTARLALATRIGRPVDLTEHEAMAWSYRGSPHVHRRSGLPAIADAMWPLSDRDALNRLGGMGRALEESATPPREAFTSAVRAMAEVVTEPMAKGEASALVTERLPEEVVGFCRPCGSAHVAEMLFRSTALPAGLEIVPGRTPLTFAPMAGWPGSSPDPSATVHALRAYLRLLGPGSQGDAASFVGTQVADAKDIWPQDVVEVSVEGRRAWFPQDELADLLAVEPTAMVRLLPPGDPYLHARDRDVVVPDPARQKQLWKILGNPGAVLVDGEIAGTWRPKAGGKRLTITVAPFGRLSKATRAAVEDEAALVAEVRGAATVDVAYAPPA